MSEDDMTPIVQKTINYVVRFNAYSDSRSSIIRTAFTREGINEPEATKLWNLAPKSTEQAIALIPALESYDLECIEKIIKEMAVQ